MIGTLAAPRPRLRVTDRILETGREGVVWGCTIPPHRLADDEHYSHNLDRGDEMLGT